MEIDIGQCLKCHQKLELLKMVGDLEERLKCRMDQGIDNLRNTMSKESQNDLE
jgi:hypothetical protein